jgi:hemerythrin-like domain-containing protein
VTTAGQWLTAHVMGDHARLLERLRSLDHCLDNILYHGAVWPEQRGLGGLRIRCRELHETLCSHVPAEERLFNQLAERGELEPLLRRLHGEHQELVELLEEILQSLDAAMAGAADTEVVLGLQEKVRSLSAALQEHIALEDRSVLPLLAAARVG